MDMASPQFVLGHLAVFVGFLPRKAVEDFKKGFLAHQAVGVEDLFAGEFFLGGIGALADEGLKEVALELREHRPAVG